MATTVEQVVATLSAAIDRGDYKPGHALPSKSSLVAELGVGDSTVQRAYESLLRDGIVQGRRGAGFFVRPPAPQVRIDDAVAELPAPTPLTDAPPPWVAGVLSEPTGTVQIGESVMRLRWTGTDISADRTSGEQTIAARSSTSSERETLDLPVGAIVFDIRRGAPTEVEQLVLAAADHVLRL